MDRGRRGHQEQQAFAVARHAQLVQRHAREIVEQGSEAADRQPVGVSSVSAATKDAAIQPATGS